MNVRRSLLFALLLVFAVALSIHPPHCPAASLPASSAAGSTSALSKAAGRADEQFKHGRWPFFPPVRPAMPAVKDQAWVRNPIDAFVLARLERAGLHPNREADRPTLLRRVTYDLTGLPPTPEEQAAFLADKSPQAYEHAVDRLLTSPHYGEQWAEHWLDVVRYAETDGFNEDGFRSNAYRYRDYVIRSFNVDLPYDRFIRQQIAGDEIEPKNPDAIIATGYCRLYPDEYNAADLRLRRQEVLEDITDTTGLAFLGLTIGCAQCHNHKFDPILQSDYYRLQAFFAPMVPHDDLPLSTRADEQRFAVQQAAWERTTASTRAEIDSLLAPLRKKQLDKSLGKFNAEVLEALHTSGPHRSAIQQQLVFQANELITADQAKAPTLLKGEQRKHYLELKAELAKFDSLKPAALPTARGILDSDKPPPPTFRLVGGVLAHPAEQVQPGFPLFLGASTAKFVSPRGNPSSTGRRTALANWLARRDNPLTSRVMVNRLWQYHFGQGIVATPNDFGAAGDGPTNPELLDWLATEFVDSGWSIKHMQRLMVLSAAYRQSANVAPTDPIYAKAQKIDPGNRLLWHARRQRLTGESLRDAMLLVAGDLNLRLFGPSVHPALPVGLGGMEWRPDSSAADRNRRSIYVIAKRNLRLPLLDAFDLPDMHNSCGRRTTTTTAPQALLMLNDDFAIVESRNWAGKLLAEIRAPKRSGAPQDDANRRLIRLAYAEAYDREPTPSELGLCTKFIAAQTALIAQSGKPPEPATLPDPATHSTSPAHDAAIVDFCHAIFESNEFLYVD